MAGQPEGTHPYRVSFELPGGGRFEAEGDKETVQGQFQAFLAAVAQQAEVQAGSPDRKRVEDEPEQKQDQEPKPKRRGDVPSEIMGRVFAVDDKGIVSLLHQPRTENRGADGLVMLLFGFLQLRDMDQVPATDLMKAARQSGLTGVDRVDRTITPNARYVTTGGARKGKRYGLNNPGIEYAKQLVTTLFD